MSENAYSDEEPLFANLRDGDPALAVARFEAQDRLPQFKAAFPARRFRSAAFVVKVPFVDRSAVGEPALAGTTEVIAENPKRPIAHLWLGVTSIDDDLLFCSVLEAPKPLGLSKGDCFVILEEMVEDWMILHQGVAYGGFSMRVLRDRLGEIEKRRFDEHTGIREFRQDMP
jgi:hypothetical protein